MLAYQLQTHIDKKLCFFIIQGIKCGNLTQSFSTPTCSQAPSNKKVNVHLVLDCFYKRSSTTVSRHLKK